MSTFTQSVSPDHWIQINHTYFKQIQNFSALLQRHLMFFKIFIYFFNLFSSAPPSERLCSARWAPVWLLCVEWAPCCIWTARRRWCFCSTCLSPSPSGWHHNQITGSDVLQQLKWMNQKCPKKKTVMRMSIFIFWLLRQLYLFIFLKMQRLL